MKVRPSIVVVENERVMLMRYRYGQTDVYNLPGGNPDPHETLVETLVRELEEELGIKIVVENLLLTGEVMAQNPSKEDVLHVLFSGKIVVGTPVINPAQTSAQALEWQSISQLRTLAMYPQVGEQLYQLLTQKSMQPYIGKINQIWY